MNFKDAYKQIEKNYEAEVREILVLTAGTADDEAFLKYDSYLLGKSKMRCVGIPFLAAVDLKDNRLINETGFILRLEKKAMLTKSRLSLSPFIR